MSNISFENFIAKTNYLESKGIFIYPKWIDGKVYAIVKENDRIIKGKIGFESCIKLQSVVAHSLYQKIKKYESENIN